MASVLASSMRACVRRARHCSASGGPVHVAALPRVASAAMACTTRTSTRLQLRSVTTTASASIQHVTDACAGASTEPDTHGSGSYRPPRDSKYHVVTPSDLEALADMVGGRGTARLVVDADQMSTYNADWMNSWHGDAPAALRPKTTEEVSAILAYCNRHGIAVVPQGGNTGLVGGSIPVHDELVLSTSLMNNIVSFDEGSGVLVCEAGCVLEQLDDWLRERDHIMPLDLGAKGSCQIGGNASTNAGGLRYLRYGSLHGSILGLEVVKADGTVLDMLNTLRKDNVGPDLKQLFIGSEGTLGVITKLAIQVPRKPSSVHVAFFACSEFGQVQATLVRAKQMLGEVLSAIEFADEAALGACINYLKEEHPLGTPSPFSVVLETSGSNTEHDMDKLMQFLEVAMEEGLVTDGVVAQDETQANRLWALRDQIAVAFNSAGHMYAYDVSLPLSKMYELVDVTRERLSGVEGHTTPPLVAGFGHLGDCNLHICVGTPRDAPSLTPHLEPFLFEWTAAHGGSISAEHGVGQSKRDLMGLQRSPQVLDVMAQLKHAFDPRGILNPYKVVHRPSPQ